MTLVSRIVSIGVFVELAPISLLTHHNVFVCWHVQAGVLVSRGNSGESVTIERRQRFEGGFHIRKKYSKKWAGVSPQKCGLTPPGGQFQYGRQLNENKSIV